MKRQPITVVTAAPPDPQAAADAMLPLFLAFLDGRLKRPSNGAAHVEPARADEESRELPP